jgi:hypothetical protein
LQHPHGHLDAFLRWVLIIRKKESVRGVRKTGENLNERMKDALGEISEKF